MITQKQIQTAQRNGMQDGKKWAVDTSKTGRTWTSDRLLSISNRAAGNIGPKHGDARYAWAIVYLQALLITLRNEGALTMEQWEALRADIAGGEAA